MTSALLDPDMAEPMGALQDIPEVSAESLESYRSMAFAQGGDTVKGEEVIIPASATAPAIRLLLYRPSSPSAVLRPALFHIHGGGYVMGNPEMSDVANARRASLHDAIVVSVDYRLAPEVRFPAPLEDCYAAFQWLFANADGLGVDEGRIAVIGESSGGGLATALTLLARDRQAPLPSALFLIYPMLDHRTGGIEGETSNPNIAAGAVAWTRGSNRFGWATMAGDYAFDDDRIGYFSPARAASVEGLPPTFIAVGTLDLFFEEDVAFALKLSRAGVPVEFHAYPGAPHCFDLMAPGARVTQNFTTVLEGAISHALR